MKLSLKLLGVAMAMMPASAFASTTIVNISGTVSGCTPCNGYHPAPGTTVGSLINPVLVDFSAGTYTVTNAVGQAGATPGYDAWRFNGSESNWIWTAMIIDAATRQVILDTLPDPQAFVGTHDQVANADYARKYTGNFTLAEDTTLAFVLEDYYLPDNAGGVALKISSFPAAGGVPEPSTWGLFIAGFGMIGAAKRSRSRKIAAMA